MAKAKAAEGEVKPKAPQKKTTAKSAATAAAETEIRVKQAPGTVAAVMSLPPPTGQPPKSPPKTPRLADSASSYKPAAKRAIAVA